MDMELKHLTWGNIDQLVYILARKVRESRFPIQKIYTIPRGGMIVGVMLAHHLGVQNVRSPELGSRSFEGREGILIVDDIVDKGKTLMDWTSRMQGAQFASLLLRYSSTRLPTYYAQMIQDDNWICFPWELDSNRDQQEYKDRAIRNS